ncbi:3121_t:CDS:2 [Paraglomus occultum]|uniref:3121_t:CDS:1 n=1 Tax=Paraglomus occultum TaxID=144539 RepID=A0A9N9F4I2_9GLOM|nr:3121_t:CDS:2 [Paraglomus occultum]
MESLLKRPDKEVVDNNSATPSLTDNTNTINKPETTTSNTSFSIDKDGLEYPNTERTDSSFPPIIRNKDKSNTRNKDNIESDNFIDDYSSQNLILPRSEQPSNQQPSFFFPKTAGRNNTTSKVTEGSATPKDTDVDPQTLHPSTNLSKGSSSKGSPFSKHLDTGTLLPLVEEEIDTLENMDNFEIKSRHVNNPNRDVLFRRFGEESENQSTTTEKFDTKNKKEIISHQNNLTNLNSPPIIHVFGRTTRTMGFFPRGGDEDITLTPLQETSPEQSPSTVQSQSDTSSPSQSTTTWRWPKPSFSPKARGEYSRPSDNPADHIGKVGNTWAKKTLEQLRKYHQRRSPSILGKGHGFTVSTPSKDPSLLQPPVSDVKDAAKTPVAVPEQPLATITEEDEGDDIGVWSSEEVDLTDPGKGDPSSNPPIVGRLRLLGDKEPTGMRVSPDHLIVVGGSAVRHNSPSNGNVPVSLRNPNSSSLAKHNAKPLYETKFTISNIGDQPLRYEILWPAFRFDISPAYGIIMPKSTTAIKLSVMMKHLVAGSKMDDPRDSKSFIGFIKGSEKDEDRPLMGKTSIIIRCENGDHKEIGVDIVQVKKKAKGELEQVKGKNSKDDTRVNFLSRISKSGRKSLSGKMDDLLKVAKARATAVSKKGGNIEDKSNSSSVKGKSTVLASGSSGKISSTRKGSTSNAFNSRSSSPEGKPAVRRRVASSSLSSRPSTPDTNRSRRGPSPASNVRSGTPDGHRNINQSIVKQPPQRKNFISIGVPGNVSCTATTVRGTSHDHFRIHNPTNKPVTWHLTTATNAFLRRSESSTAQKITDDVFLISKTSGFLRPGQTERVDYNFHPLFVGTYVQNFMLEGSMNPDTTGGVAVRIQGDGKEDNTVSAGGTRDAEFQVSERDIRIAPTRVGRRRCVGFQIINPSDHVIKIRCKCEAVAGSTALSIPLSSVQLKPGTSFTMPVRFLPKEPGEIRGVIELRAFRRNEVRVNIVAEGITDQSSETAT